MTLAISLPAAAQVAIDTPNDGQPVCHPQQVGGSVTGDARSDPSRQVWVVVHPMLIANYFVQTAGTLKATGQWTLFANFGRPGQDHNVPFEFRAFVGPTTPLHTGQVLNQWPEAKWSSDVVDVRRGGAC